MGTWGYEPLDSDAALDVQHIWEHIIANRVQLDGWSTPNIVEYFENRWGDAVNHGDSVTNSEILALLEIVTSQSLPITDRLRKIAADAIHRELEPSELDSWDDPARRERGLVGLLNHIGVKRDTGRRRPRPWKEAAPFPSKDAAERQLLELTQYGRKLLFSFDLWNNEEMRKSVPTLLHSLNRLVHHNIEERDSNLAIEVISQRHMIIALYLGMSLGYDRDRIASLIHDARWDPPPRERKKTRSSPA